LRLNGLEVANVKASLDGSDMPEIVDDLAKTYGNEQSNGERLIEAEVVIRHSGLVGAPAVRCRGSQDETGAAPQRRTGSGRRS